MSPRPKYELAIMNTSTVASLEALLKLRGSLDPNGITADASILTCGCVVSESFFLSNVDSNGKAACPDCSSPQVSFLRPIRQLRELYKIVLKLQNEVNDSSLAIASTSGGSGEFKARRRSSSKKSLKDVDREQMDLISLFYKYAKEETHPDVVSSINANVDPINIELPNDTYTIPPISPRKYSPQDKKLSLEDKMLSTLSEEKEYNFSKCFPFHRKLTTFQTYQKNLFFKNSMLKKGPRYNCSFIHTSTDPFTGEDYTRFVMMTDKRWELYELSKQDSSPIMICCGKSNGEYGPSFADLKEEYGQEIIIRNDFSGQSDNNDDKKKLNSWELLNCQINNDFLVISGTKGIMRVFNISKKSLPHEMGKPLYTYFTNFPIRCISISPTDGLIACSITARERVSGKEQPFIILHKMNRSNSTSKIISSVEPITITVPYRDPIKLINFNATSTHLICCTVWESRYLIIRLRSSGSDNFRKPRLIWTEQSIAKARKRKDSFYNDSDGEEAVDDDALMMDNEGITDVQFGTIPNTIVLTSCSLQNRPPVMLRLEGSSIDYSYNRNLSDSISLSSSTHSKNDDEDHEITNIQSSGLLLRFLEIGFSIHKVAISPRRDALAFLDKDGRIYLVAIPNHELSLNTPIKKVVVQLGEVSNAERYTESGSIKFSADGGKIYVTDRKGTFLIFDFTKGIPGQDSDVVKCKIINV